MSMSDIRRIIEETDIPVVVRRTRSSKEASAEGSVVEETRCNRSDVIGGVEAIEPVIDAIWRDALTDHDYKDCVEIYEDVKAKFAQCPYKALPQLRKELFWSAAGAFGHEDGQLPPFVHFIHWGINLALIRRCISFRNARLVADVTWELARMIHEFQMAEHAKVADPRYTAAKKNREKAARRRESACEDGLKAERRALEEGLGKNEAKSRRVDAMVRHYESLGLTLERRKASEIYNKWLKELQDSPV